MDRESILGVMFLGMLKDKADEGVRDWVVSIAAFDWGCRYLLYERLKHRCESDDGLQCGETVATKVRTTPPHQVLGRARPRCTEPRSHCWGPKSDRTSKGRILHVFLSDRILSSRTSARSRTMILLCSSAGYIRIHGRKLRTSQGFVLEWGKSSTSRLTSTRRTTVP